eukprot:gb/GECG01007776.1/.p1 GENE.gb/GECG01007776.1/~~gb/GECG01007776.1/.p1  ORF type:complete len:285 (+),score=38.24 gb/GECG01007776.1/:1-855(+)
MEGTSSGGRLEDFLPELIVRYIKGCESRGRSPHRAPFSHDLQVVAMFVDISGFTKLSETLARGGGLGAERLAFYLNRYFEQLARIVTKNSGDVFKFAGDALLAIWWQSESNAARGGRKSSLGSAFDDDNEDDQLFEFSDDDEDENGREAEERAGVKRREAKERDLTLPCRRAISAATAIQSELDSANLAEGITFSVKLGLGVGRMSLLFTGGVFGRAEYLANGPALKQAFLCEEDCEPGQLIISEEVLGWVEPLEIYENLKLPSGNARIDLTVHVICNRTVPLT